MTLEEILKGMSHNVDVDRTYTTNFGNQSYDFVNRVNNSVQVSKEGNSVIFTFKVDYLNYQKWTKGGSYRSPYHHYTNSGSVSFTKEELQNFPQGFNHLINLYNRLKRSVSSGSEWREIMRYFWKDWDFPDTAEKKQLQQDAACLKAIIDKDTPVSIANAYLATSSLLDRLYPNNFMHNSILKEALKWWGSMPCELKDKFHEPQSDEDILAYYDTPSEYIYDSMGY